MSSVFEPEPESLDSLIEVLALGQDPHAQSVVFEQLAEFRQDPDYYKYLTYIFVHLREDDAAMEVAGWSLRGDLGVYWNDMSEKTQYYIKQEFINLAVPDTILLKQKVLAAAMTTVLRHDGVQSWTDLVHHFLDFLDPDGDTRGVRHRRSSRDDFVDDDDGNGDDYDSDNFARRRGNAFDVDDETVHFALRGLHFICTDCSDELLHMRGSLLRRLVLLILPFLQHPTEPIIRVLALRCLNPFASRMPKVMTTHIEELIDGYFFIMTKLSEEAEDDEDQYHYSQDLRQIVCSSISTLFTNRPDYLMEHVSDILSFIIETCVDSDLHHELTLIRALDFFFACSRSPSALKFLHQRLSDILPLLFRFMQLDEYDRFQYGAGKDDPARGDDGRTIKPKQHRQSSSSSSSTRRRGDDNEEDADADSDLDSDSEISLDDDSEGDRTGAGDIFEGELNKDQRSYELSRKAGAVGGGAGGGGWSLRQQAASCIELLAHSLSTFEDQHLYRSSDSNHFVQEVFALLDEGLADEDEDVDDEQEAEAKMLQREATVLGIGSIAGGCALHIVEYLPDIIKLLLSMLSQCLPTEAELAYEESRHPGSGRAELEDFYLVKHGPLAAITCWTLSRYAKWIRGSKHQSDDEHGEDRHVEHDIEAKTMELILQCCRARSKHLRSNAVRALSVFIEELSVDVIPYLDHILYTLYYGLLHFGQVNVELVFECLNNLVEQIGPALSVLDSPPPSWFASSSSSSSSSKSVARSSSRRHEDDPDEAMWWISRLIPSVEDIDEMQEDELKRQSELAGLIQRRDLAHAFRQQQPQRDRDQDERGLVKENVFHERIVPLVLEEWERLTLEGGVHDSNIVTIAEFLAACITRMTLASTQQYLEYVFLKCLDMLVFVRDMHNDAMALKQRLRDQLKQLDADYRDAEQDGADSATLDKLKVDMEDVKGELCVIEYPNASIYSLAFDLISSVIEKPFTGVGQRNDRHGDGRELIIGLVQRDETLFYELVAEGINTPYVEAKSTGLAVLGELVLYFKKQAYGLIPEVRESLLLALQIHYPFLCDNASWCLGEVMISLAGIRRGGDDDDQEEEDDESEGEKEWKEEQIEKMAEEAVERLSAILENRTIRRKASYTAMMRNVAVCFGRVVLAVTTALDRDGEEIVLRILQEETVEGWSAVMALYELEDFGETGGNVDEERYEAFVGVVRVLLMNPSILSDPVVDKWKEFYDRDEAASSRKTRKKKKKSGSNKPQRGGMGLGAFANACCSWAMATRIELDPPIDVEDVRPCDRKQVRRRLMPDAMHEQLLELFGCLQDDLGSRIWGDEFASWSDDCQDAFLECFGGE